MESIGKQWKTKSNLKTNSILRKAAIILLTLSTVTAFAQNQPQNVTVTEGETATFSFSVVGVVINNPQWEVSTDNGNTWNGIWGGNYSGEFSETLTIFDVPSSYNGYQYRLSYAIGNNVFKSNTFILTVIAIEIPAIISHPVDVSIPAGNDASFSVTTAEVTGFSYDYQWQVRTGANAAWSNVSNGGIYSNATTPTLTLTNVPITYNNYQYRCRVIAPDWNYWTDYSNAGTLVVVIVDTPPVITTTFLPDAERVKPYHTTLTATGTTPITWRIDAGSLPNGLTLNANTGVISGTPSTTGAIQFTVRATNRAGYDTKLLRLTVTEAQPPSVIEVTSPPASSPFCTANDVLPISFRKLDNTHPMKYRLRFSDDAKAAGFKDGTTFENLPADLSFKIEVPKGAQTGSYSGFVIIQCEGLTSYRDEYPFTFSVTNNGIAIVNQPPAMQTLCSGATVTLGVGISGNAAGYQWYRNNQAISGAGNREYVASSEGSYFVEIRGTCGTLRSAVSVVVPPSANPSGVTVRVKWGNVLYVENAADKYERFQWMHNKTPINGATCIYLYEKNGFLGEYSVRCFKADGTYDETCPVVFDVRTRSGIEIYPTMAKLNDVLNIHIADPNTLTGFQTLSGLDEMEATVEIYSLLGVKVWSTKITTPVSTIRPDFRSKGNFFVRITLPSGEVFTEKIVVR